LAGGDGNLYRYVGNNPLGKRDPRGLCPDLPSLNNPFAYGVIPNYFSNQVNGEVDGAAAALETVEAAGAIAAAAVAAPEAYASFGAALLTYSPDAANTVEFGVTAVSTAAQAATGATVAPDPSSNFLSGLLNYLGTTPLSPLGNIFGN
jgi:hypothetical protein